MSPPWTGLFDMTPFLVPEEQRELNAREERKKELRKSIVERLAKEPKPVVKITYENEQALIDIGGKKHLPLIYNASGYWAPDNPGFIKQVENFRKAGFHLYGLEPRLTKYWKPDGSIDFSAIDNFLESAVMMTQEGYIMFDIVAHEPPRWWLDKYPEELIDYANGGINPKAYDTIDRVRAPSYASEIWRRDFCDLVRKIVQHIEASPYSKRVFAYRIDYGVYCEWHYYGMEQGMPDTSKPMTEAFRKWLENAYKGDVAALRNAWNDTTVTFQNATVPDKAARSHTGAGILRDHKANRQAIDYLTCMGQVVKDCLLLVNKTAKEACGNRALLGNYCGYFFGMAYPAEGWHLANDEILDSPYVDFQVSPQCYGSLMRSIGEPQSARMLAEAYRRRGKLAIIEADTRTHVQDKAFGHTFVDTPAQSVSVLSRDFGQALALGCGIWYYDFGNIWYSDPLIVEMFAKLPGVRSRGGDFGSASEVVYIGDYANIMYSNVVRRCSLYENTVTLFWRELSHTGVPCDAASFQDLASGKLKDYKVYIFPNLYYATPEQRQLVKKLQQRGAIILWFFAPGYLTPSGPSLEAMEDLTGFKLKIMDGKLDSYTTLLDGRKATSWHTCQLSPAIAIDDKDATIHGTNTLDGKTIPTFATKGNNILCTAAFLDRFELKKLFQSYSIHAFNDDPEAVVFANRSFITFHNKKAGEQTIHLPRKANVTMLYPVEKPICENKSEFSFEAPEDSTFIFKYE
jgi:hypothetical protein